MVVVGGVGCTWCGVSLCAVAAPACWCALRVLSADADAIGGYLVSFPSSASGFFSGGPREEAGQGLGWTRLAISGSGGKEERKEERDR